MFIIFTTLEKAFKSYLFKYIADQAGVLAPRCLQMGFMAGCKTGCDMKLLMLLI